LAVKHFVVVVVVVVVVVRMRRKKRRRLLNIKQDKKTKQPLWILKRLTLNYDFILSRVRVSATVNNCGLQI
jgi:hypothetical protein